MMARTLFGASLQKVWEETMIEDFGGVLESKVNTSEPGAVATGCYHSGQTRRLFRVQGRIARLS
jgi:hypothetical protein